MMCGTKHEILITNLQDGEVILQEIILIKGVISNACEVPIIRVREDKTNCRKTFVISKLNGFKILWKLIPGLNDFEIVYCNSSTKITCSFKEFDSEYRIQPLYLICNGHNGRFHSDSAQNDSNEACKKITLGLKLVQTLYAEKILEHGFCRKTFKLNSDCLVFNSKLNVEKAYSLDENALWNAFAYEIINSNWGENEKLKFVAFIGCTKYETIDDNDFSYSNIKKNTKGNAALGGGGLALFGSGSLYCWPTTFEEILPCFQNKKPIDLKKFPDDSNYRRTYGGCYATTIGAICHEIGHTFDLGHTEDGIMGNGFDYANLVFTVNNLTEHLPDRSVQDVVKLPKNDRLTSLKKPSTFLKKYHQQKLGDATFFSRNCVVTLYYHKWLNNYLTNEQSEIIFDCNKFTVISKGSYIKLIEVRKKSNGFVLDSKDFSMKIVDFAEIEPTFNFSEHNLFVITSDGTIKLFDSNFNNV